MKAIKFLAYLVVAILLTGCLATVDGLKKDANEALAKLSEATAQSKTPSISRADSAANEYAAFARAELELIKRLAAHQRYNGLNSWVSERRINVRSNTWPARTQSVQIAASFRLELPTDTVSARHRSVLAAIDSMAEYVAMRNKQEPSRLVLVGRDQADVLWMREAAEETLARRGVSGLPINMEISKGPSVGWMSEGAVDRVI